MVRIALVIGKRTVIGLDAAFELVDHKGLIEGIVAQLEERLLHTQEVIGSSPVGPIFVFNALRVPQVLAKDLADATLTEINFT